MPTLKVTRKDGETSEYHYPDSERGHLQCDAHKEALERLQDCNSFTVEKIDNN